MTRTVTLLPLGLLMCLFAPSPTPAAPTAAAHGCGDFLGRLHKKPAHVIYSGCHLAPDRQGKPMRATYRVQGRFAGQAETYLIRAPGLTPLKRSCCQWDSPAHTFYGADGMAYSITMVSEETAVSNRVTWRRIATFEIIVETFTEEI